ncbi:LacI family DNA-binding transcriptional regulator [Actinoplanes sp. Pm04-4]|jgi:LacI family transcriptional regulator|uniref:LacI family DNA-binding transcriptional regulator n=1 Tax=Paractinoplanes pyxinae TaxID=2997416 RepID=A0ABT4AV58_9ACTN|nr:LacI family DNA-binding transcriptional regulator [Actinoplanes pyxinae]MCY1138123.1 LacI family DNA-binding transcriptional regulator [Actinoplanes pyxinae]
MATIYEVAALAGVSPATVSRVFNGNTVSPEKQRAVREAAAKLAFTPNKTARRLRKQSSEVVALLIPDIENPFFTALARGVEDKAQESGFSVVLCNTDDDPGKELRYLQIAASEQMAGVILAPASDEADLGAIASLGSPVVAVDRTTPYPVDAVKVDNRAAGIAATTALFDAGHRRIACIAGPVGIESTEDRFLGWRQVMTARRAAIPEGYLQHANFRADGGHAAMRHLLALPEPPEAVLTTNNLMGVGALQAVVEAGVDPARFGLAVVGELPFMFLTPPAVVQVRLPARHLGTTAATMLLERIGGDAQPPRTVVLRAELA